MEEVNLKPSDEETVANPNKENVLHQALSPPSASIVGETETLVLSSRTQPTVNDQEVDRKRRLESSEPGMLNKRAKLGGESSVASAESNQKSSQISGSRPGMVLGDFIEQAQTPNASAASKEGLSPEKMREANGRIRLSAEKFQGLLTNLATPGNREKVLDRLTQMYKPKEGVSEAQAKSLPESKMQELNSAIKNGGVVEVNDKITATYNKQKSSWSISYKEVDGTSKVCDSQEMIKARNLKVNQQVQSDRTAQAKEKARGKELRK